MIPRVGSKEFQYCWEARKKVPRASRFVALPSRLGVIAYSRGLHERRIRRTVYTMNIQDHKSTQNYSLNRKTYKTISRLYTSVPSSWDYTSDDFHRLSSSETTADDFVAGLDPGGYSFVYDDELLHFLTSSNVLGNMPRVTMLRPLPPARSLIIKAVWDWPCVAPGNTLDNACAGIVARGSVPLWLQRCP